MGVRANKGWEGYERRERKGREVGALKRVCYEKLYYVTSVTFLKLRKSS